MAYSSFTLSKVSRTFHLETVWQPGLFADIAPVEPSEPLTMTLERQLPFALAMGTEKAKSELIVAPVLVELCLHFEVPGESVFGDRLQCGCDKRPDRRV